MIRCIIDMASFNHNLDSSSVPSDLNQALKFEKNLNNPDQIGSFSSSSNMNNLVNTNAPVPKTFAAKVQLDFNNCAESLKDPVQEFDKIVRGTARHEYDSEPPVIFNVQPTSSMYDSLSSDECCNESNIAKCIVNPHGIAESDQFQPVNQRTNGNCDENYNSLIQKLGSSHETPSTSLFTFNSNSCIGKSLKTNKTQVRNLLTDEHSQNVLFDNHTFSENKFQNMNDGYQSINPTDLIMRYREEISNISEKYVLQIMHEIKKESSLYKEGKYLKIKKNRLHNLELQQKQFENSLSDTKVQFSCAYASSIESIVYNCEAIKQEFLAECRLFESFFPAYALKYEVMKAIQENQVIIICSDYSYEFNVVLPAVIKKQFIVSCESSVVARNRLCKYLTNFVKQPVVNEFENSLTNQMLVTTENDLLHCFSRKLSLERTMYIIFNLELNRSVTSDILLASFKNMLEYNKNSKLILLLSPVADVQIYQKYFSKFINSPLLSTPTLLFPVTTVWKNDSLASVDYVEEVIRTIIAIHILEGMGDVMVFLPSNDDIDHVSKLLLKSCFELQLNDLKTILLDDFASYDSDLISKVQNKNVRKVFLATCSAEIFAIKYVDFVIDCGVQKTHAYDCNKNQDVIKTTLISRPNAKIRKYLAGVSGPGICYRIYSKRNYSNDMLPRMQPEIFTVNPINTVLKIFQHKLYSGRTIEIIEPLPLEILGNTLQDLERYGAIKDNNLTSLGEDMLSLPFAAKYSRLILASLERGFVFEAIIMVVFLIKNRRIFKNPLNDKQQRAIDAKKLKLIQDESDTLTYIYIYKKYTEEGFSSVWCEDHYIEQDVLQSIHECVLEMCQIMNHSLGVTILREFSASETFCTDFTDLLFDCFHDTLCVYTGHCRSGYRVLSTSSVAHINPCSIICQKGNLPQFILYDQMISVNRNLLVHVTVVPPDVILRGLRENMLDFDYADIFEKTLVNRIVEPVGEEVMKNMLLGSDGEKLKMIENQLKSETGSDFIFLELSLQKGRVQIFAMSEHIDYAQCAIEDILSSKRMNMLNEQQMEILELKKGRNKAYVEMNYSKGAVATSVSVTFQKQLCGSHHQDIPTGSAADNFNESLAPYYLLLSWVRRPCNGEGFVNFCSTSNFMTARKKALKYVRMLGTEVFIQVGRNRDNQLQLTGLPPETRSHNIEREVGQLLPDLKIDSIELNYKAPFETPDIYINDIKYQIIKKLKEFALIDCDVVVLKAKPTDIDMVIQIRTFNSEILDFVAEILTSVIDKKFITQVLYNVVINCNMDMCKVLKPRFTTELVQLKQDLERHSVHKGDHHFSFCISVESGDRGVIKLSASNSEILKFLHRTVSDLLEGETLDLKNVKGLQNLFFHGGLVWLRCLERAEGVYIVENHETKSIKLYGSVEDSENAKYQIIKFLEDAENDVMLKITLSSDQNNNMLLKAVIKEYGVHLERFIEAFELKSALLDIKARELLLRGSRNNVEKAENCIQELSNGLDIIFPNADLSQETCPVCSCPAFGLTFRLEHCGHLYCLECIQALIEQAQFPLRCCFENCSKDIVLNDIRKILNEDQEKRNILFEKSMKDYLEKNRERIVYCPAPDCSMFFYKTDLSGNKITCSLCKNEVCVKCNVLYHGGYTCDMYQNSKNDPDYSFKVWQKTTRLCKQCPRCKTAIEKISGCNRMACTSCKGRFCWICVKEFRTDQDVYIHIDASHQGMLFA